MVQSIMSCHIDDALSHMNQVKHSAHYIIIYSDLDTLRKLYSSYIDKRIKENNEIVLINPFYETTNSVRHVLSEKYDDGAVKPENEKTLIIADSLERHFGDQNTDDKSFKMSLVNHAKKIGKNGLSILDDMGAYTHMSKHDDLINYEFSLSGKYEDGIVLKDFCLYHKKDFERLSEEQKQKLLEHHDMALRIVQTQ
jgi:hypothetical protein